MFFSIAGMGRAEILSFRKFQLLRHRKPEMGRRLLLFRNSLCHCMLILVNLQGHHLDITSQMFLDISIFSPAMLICTASLLTSTITQLTVCIPTHHLGAVIRLLVPVHTLQEELQLSSIRFHSINLATPRVLEPLQLLQLVMAVIARPRLDIQLILL